MLTFHNGCFMCVLLTLLLREFWYCLSVHNTAAPSLPWLPSPTASPHPTPQPCFSTTPSVLLCILTVIIMFNNIPSKISMSLCDCYFKEIHYTYLIFSWVRYSNCVLLLCVLTSMYCLLAVQQWKRWYINTNMLAELPWGRSSLCTFSSNWKYRNTQKLKMIDSQFVKYYISSKLSKPSTQSTIWRFFHSNSACQHHSVFSGTCQSHQTQLLASGHIY